MVSSERHDEDGRRRLIVRVVLAGTLPFLVLVFLFTSDIPLGQPHLLYRYSPLWGLRVVRALGGIVVGIGGVAMLHRGLRVDGRRAPWLVGAVVSYIVLVAFPFFALPRFTEQHLFNMLSPSHDGAFLWEARHIESLRDYLARDFYAVLQRTPEDMRGRRVLSNPPGTTALAVLTMRLMASLPSVRSRAEPALGLDEIESPKQRLELLSGFVLALGFTIMWAAAIVPAYALCRLWLEPLPAVAVALGMVYNPATVNFTPGKDPAQLFSVLLILFLWFLANHRRNRWYAVGCGAVVAAAMMIGLIHLWVIAIAACATVWHSWRMRRQASNVVLHGLLPLAAGGLALCALAYVALGWNLILTVWRVALRYGQIQEGIIAEPFYWTFVGLPLFLLFVGPLFWIQWTAIRADRHDAEAQLGGCVLLLTTALMTYAYFFANNNETPRLWIPLIPFLLLGMALRRTSFRKPARNGRTVLLLIVALQVTVTLLHWSLMDVRESEYRLFTTGRMWD